MGEKSGISVLLLNINCEWVLSRNLSPKTIRRRFKLNRVGKNSDVRVSF